MLAVWTLGVSGFRLKLDRNIDTNTTETYLQIGVVSLLLYSWSPLAPNNSKDWKGHYNVDGYMYRV